PPPSDPDRCCCPPQNMTAYATHAATAVRTADVAPHGFIAARQLDYPSTEAPAVFSAGLCVGKLSWITCVLCMTPRFSERSTQKFRCGVCWTAPSCSAGSSIACL
ncbi:unnamed protein product, partial [Ectocarpus sp. 12 AP-2014]